MIFVRKRALKQTKNPKNPEKYKNKRDKAYENARYPAAIAPADAASCADSKSSILVQNVLNIPSFFCFSSFMCAS